MEFPNEILNLIVIQGLDCCKTTISWSQISKSFKDLIVHRLGIIVLLDGYSSIAEVSIPSEYGVLMTDSNTLFMVTDHLQEEQLIRFIPNFMDLLILVESNRSYSDLLAGAFYNIAQKCTQSTNISIVYRTSLNFLSKLYFRELALYRDKINLCELHVIGTDLKSRDELCDINTLFERTYIKNLRSVYSLDIQVPEHQLVSKDLQFIKLLNLARFDEQTSNFLSGCPNLKIIESTKFPTSTTNENGTFRLPKCDSINLTNYIDGAHNPDLDGSHVYKVLTLSPSLRSPDPEFRRLFFPQAQTLSLNIADNGMHCARFSDCYFPNLKTLICGASVVPWSDLREAECHLEKIKLTLTSVEQLEWLTSCPQKIGHVYIEAPKPKITHIPISPTFEQSQIYSEVVDIEMNHLWQCYLLEKLLLGGSKSIRCLKVVLDESSLLDSMISTTIPIDKWQLNHDDDFIIFNLPLLDHFTLLIKNSSEDKGSLSIRKFEEQSSSNSLLSPSGSSNVFFDSDVMNKAMYAVSPSDFRRNSLAGADSQTARRQSAIVFSSSPGERRRSSLGGPAILPIIISDAKEDNVLQKENIVFAFKEDCAGVLTTNIPALDSSLFSWNEAKSRTIHLLEMQIEDITIPYDLDLDSIDKIVALIVQEAIEILKYPYNIRLPGTIIERFRILVDFSDIDIYSSEEYRSVLPLQIQTLLTFKGFPIKVYSDKDESDSRVCLLMKFQ